MHRCRALSDGQIEWPIFCTYDLLHADSKTTGYRIIYYKTRYLYYYYVSGRMRDYDYGLSLLGKRPYLVTGLASREVRTRAIFVGADTYGHAGSSVT